MDKQYRLLIPGAPVPKARPGKKPTRKAGFSRSYDTQAKLKEQYQLHIMAQWGKEEILTGPLVIEAQYYFERPKSHFTPKGNVRKNTPLYHTIKPDVDNLDKFLFDCMAGIIFKDDTQIIRSNTAKGYLHKAQTIVFIKTIKNRYL